MFRKFTGIFILLSFFFIRTGVLPVTDFLDGLKKDSLEQYDKDSIPEENKEEAKESKKIVEDYFYKSDYSGRTFVEAAVHQLETSIGKVTFVPMPQPCPPPRMITV